MNYAIYSLYDILLLQLHFIKESLVLEEIKDKIIGGVIVLVIGGTGFAVSQTDIVNNFASETGMSQEEAKKYASDVEKDAASFSEIGQDFLDDGNSALSSLAQIDCINNAYEWETASLGCSEGKEQLQKIGEDEVALGNCYKKLGSDLGSTATTQMNECISNIDTVNADYSLPIAAALMDPNDIAEFKKANLYNKSVLKSALQSD